MSTEIHCQDCCCARSWKELGIDSYTGKSIPQHIEILKAELAAAHADITRLQELNTKLLNGDEMRDTLAQLREANRVIELAEKSFSRLIRCAQKQGFNDGYETEMKDSYNAIEAIQAYKGSKP
jgi:hypothetical protein